MSILPILISTLILIVGVSSLTYSILQNKKTTEGRTRANAKSSSKRAGKQGTTRKNNELVARLIALGESQTQKEETERQTALQKAFAAKSNNEQSYYNEVQEKYRYLDFTGLNAILQKPSYSKKSM